LEIFTYKPAIEQRGGSYSHGPHARYRSKDILFDLTPVAFSRLAGLDLGLVPISKVEVLG